EIDHRFLLEQSHRYGPIFKTTHGLRPTICVVGVDRITELLRLHHRALRHSDLGFSHIIRGGFIRLMEPAQHDRYRTFIARMLSPERSEGARGLIVTATRRELDRLESSQQSADGDGIRLNHALPPALLRIFLVLFLGLEPDSAELVDLEAEYYRLNCN